MMRWLVIVGALLLSGPLMTAAVQAGELSQTIAIRDGRFVPDQLELPPETKVKLSIHNEDALPAEFESYDLSREIIVPVNQSVTVFVGPLKSGRYEFFNDFNHDMRGAIIVKPVATEEN
jgi:hypothetical protein